MWHVIEDLHADHEAVFVVLPLEVEYALVVDFDLPVVEQSFMLFPQEFLTLLSQLRADFDQDNLAMTVDFQAIVPIKVKHRVHHSALSGTDLN